MFGCTDPAATNFNPAATADDGSCAYCEAGEILDCNRVCANSAWVGDGSCDDGADTNNNGKPVYFDCD